MIFQFQIPIITVPVVWSVCSSSPNEVFQIILVVLPIPLSSLPPPTPLFVHNFGILEHAQIEQTTLRKK
jgi:hypothetical protein